MSLPNRGIDFDRDGDGDLTKSGIKFGFKLFRGLATNPKGTLAQLYVLFCLVSNIFMMILELMDYGFSLSFFQLAIATVIAFYFYKEVKKINVGYLKFFVKFIVTIVLFNFISTLIINMFS